MKPQKCSSLLAKFSACFHLPDLKALSTTLLLCNSFGCCMLSVEEISHKTHANKLSSGKTNIVWSLHFLSAFRQDNIILSILEANAVPLSQTVAFSLSSEELHSKQKSACKNSPMYFTKAKHMQTVYSYIPNIVFPAQSKLQVSVTQEEIALPRQIN